MGFYSNVVFPVFHDLAVDRPHWHKYRRELLSEASGKILEIGAGSGLNLPHYPEHVREVVAVDPNRGMSRRLQRRVHETHVSIAHRIGNAENLPFDESTFDCVVSTLTLCSVPQVDRAVGEVYRVLKPGGKFLFLDHGLSPDRRVQKWQRRLNRAWRLLGDGCRLDVDVREVVSRMAFRSITIQNFYMDESPKTLGYMYRGMAVR